MFQAAMMCLLLVVPQSPPPDRPVATASEEQAARLERAIQPYVEQARKTYPAAKKRFLAGLPPDYEFYVTTRLHDASGTFEQVFVAVEKIEKDTIRGRISTEVSAVKGYRIGDRYAFPEKDLIDWTIVTADGKEEGNFVGKFLDTYEP